MGENTSVCTSYRGQLSDERNVKNEVRQEGISLGILFYLYLNEVKSDIFKLPAGCTLKCSTLGNADNELSGL